MLKARLFSMFGIDDFPTEDLDLQVNIISIFTDEKNVGRKQLWFCNRKNCLRCMHRSSWLHASLCKMSLALSFMNILNKKVTKLLFLSYLASAEYPDRH